MPQIPGRSRAILPLQVQPYLSAGTLVLLQPTTVSPLGDNPILQEVREDGILSVLAENDGSQELRLDLRQSSRIYLRRQKTRGHWKRLIPTCPQPRSRQCQPLQLHSDKAPVEVDNAEHVHRINRGWCNSVTFTINSRMPPRGAATACVNWNEHNRPAQVFQVEEALDGEDADIGSEN